MTMMLHNYGSRQFHRTPICINPSSGFRDMDSAKSGPSDAWIDKFFGAMGKLKWGKWANNYDVPQLQVYTSPRYFKWAKSIQRFQRYAFCEAQAPFLKIFDKFLAHGQAHMGRMGKWHENSQLQALTIPQNFARRKFVKQLPRYWFRKPGAYNVESVFWYFANITCWALYSFKENANRKDDLKIT